MGLVFRQVMRGACEGRVEQVIGNTLNNTRHALHPEPATQHHTPYTRVPVKVESNRFMGSAYKSRVEQVMGVHAIVESNKLWGVSVKSYSNRLGGVPVKVESYRLCEARVGGATQSSDAGTCPHD